MSIHTETIYRVTDWKGGVSYAFTPDGEGMIWYGTLEELREDTGMVGPEFPIHHVTDHRLAEMRGHI